MSKIQIITPLRKELVIGLTNCRENMGHDDSLPYQAEICVALKPDCSDFRKIGTVVNDGWGGMSEIRIDRTDENKKLLDEISEACKEHEMYFDGKKSSLKFNLPTTLDCMAEYVCEYGKSNKQKDTCLLFHFDDEACVIANKGNNLFLINKSFKTK